MAFNWRPSKINTQLKGLPQNEDPFDYISKAIQREDMAGYRPSQNVGPINYQHGGNAPINYDGYSPTTPMTEEDIANNAINNNVNTRQFGNAGDMANWIQQGGTPQADAAAAQAQAEQQAAMAKQKQIADIQSQISVLEKRIADNKAKLSNWTGNADKIAAIEARKINVNDPTSIWRWKEDRDNARRIANEQNKTNNTARANALIEANNILDSMIINDSLDTPTKNSMLSKLADVKTNLEKNGLPTKDVDKKIEQLKGNGEQTSREAATIDFETLLDNPNLSVELLDKFEASNPNLSRADWGKLDNKRAELTNKANKKAENEAKAKERENKILSRDPNSVTSDEISFMLKRGLKRITGDKLSDTKWVKVK